MRTALVISLLTHGLAMTVHFTSPEPPKPTAQEIGMEVILVNAGTKSAPAKAEVLAQVNSDGGGNSERGRAAAPVPRSAATSDGEMLASVQQQQAQLEAQQRLLAAEVEAQKQHVAPPPAPEGANGVPTQQPVDAKTRANQLTRQFAEIANRIEDYNKRPRKHFFAPSTSEYRFATYVDQWRTRIEAVGNRNYPPEARGRLYGSLRMTVLIRADGSIESFDIDRPSEHKVLNDAARRIVALAAPFPPFPPQIAKDTDILAITRTWHFTKDSLIATPG
ncbi:membrane protein [Pigmentiphaga litoralis]|jgi:protein TonB|uniref:energy transducer TonB n=1 Tax=Pigmentiphaga litoralis TaxID=516702 RepID=UPI00167934A1|nr:TonB family protein [Pigmentiphaga litoralis]GGX27675.1 membrane protein [Pigmentiphaga litoralis]